MITIKSHEVNETTYSDLYELSESIFEEINYGDCGEYISIKHYEDGDESFYTYKLMWRNETENEDSAFCLDYFEGVKTVDELFNTLKSLESFIEQVEIQTETYRDYYDMYGVSQSDFF